MFFLHFGIVTSNWTTPQKNTWRKEDSFFPAPSSFAKRSRCGRNENLNWSAEPWIWSLNEVSSHGPQGFEASCRCVGNLQPTHGWDVQDGSRETLYLLNSPYKYQPFLNFFYVCKWLAVIFGMVYPPIFFLLFFLVCGSKPSLVKMTGKFGPLEEDIFPNWCHSVDMLVDWKGRIFKRYVSKKKTWRRPKSIKSSDPECDLVATGTTCLLK